MLERCFSWAGWNPHEPIHIEHRFPRSQIWPDTTPNPRLTVLNWPAHSKRLLNLFNSDKHWREYWVVCAQRWEWELSGPRLRLLEVNPEIWPAALPIIATQLAAIDLIGIIQWIKPLWKAQKYMSYICSSVRGCLVLHSAKYLFICRSMGCTGHPQGPCQHLLTTDFQSNKLPYHIHSILKCLYRIPSHLSQWYYLYVLTKIWVSHFLYRKHISLSNYSPNNAPNALYDWYT